MGSRVLLINTNRCTAPDPVFPLGLAHLSAALRRAGHEVVWFDIQSASQTLEQALAALKPSIVGLSLRNIDDVLIRKRETFWSGLESLCALVRRVAGCPAVLGGSGFSIFPEQLLERTGADFGVTGPGESALPALVEALERGADFTRIPGLVFRQEGRLRRNAPGLEVPPVAMSPEDRPAGVVAHYLQSGGMMNLQTQRGCACRCSYCTYPLIEGRAPRRRPPEAVAEEFEQLYRLGARYVFIVDSVFNSDPAHVAGVCEALLRLQVKMSWGCFLRPQGLTPELMKLMAQAGLAHIEFGSDSFSDPVLREYRKGFCFADILSSTELARREQVDCCHFLIAGGPGETEATLREGFEASARLDGAVFMAVVGMRVYPGTALFERALAEGCLSRESDLLDPAYYVAPALGADRAFELLQGFARRSPAWIVGDPSPAYTSLVGRLRKRGVVGPLWSYFSTLQRLWPGVGRVGD